MNPFAFLSEEEIRKLGYGSRTEFDDAVNRLGELQGLDELMKYESRFLKKQTLDSIFADSGKETPQFQLQPAPTISTTGAVIPAVPPAPIVKPPAPLPTPRFPDTTQIGLREAEIEAQKKREEAALKEGEAMSEEEKKRVSEGIAAFSEVPRTYEAVPAWSPLEKVVAPFLRMAGLETTAEALKPQPLLTPEQLQEYEQGILDRKAAGKAAFTDYFENNKADLEAIGFTKDSFVKTASDKTNDFRSYEEPDESLFSVKTVSDFIVREATGDTGWTPEYKEQYDRYMANVKPGFDPDVGMVGLLYGRRAGGIYETPLIATLRGLVLPESVVGGITSNYEGNFDERIAERLRQGKGLEAAAQDIARMAGAEPGGLADDMAWWLGLGTSFLLPIDLGATSAIFKVGGKAGDVISSVAKISGADTKLGAVKNMLGSTDEIREAIKKGSLEGVDFRTLVVSNADLIPEVQKVSKTIAELNLDKIARDADPAVFAEGIKKALGDGYDEFVSEGKRLGLDEFTPALERGVWSKRPVTELPVGDSKLAWVAFRDAMIQKTNIRLGREPGAFDVDPVELTKTIARDIAKLRLDRALAQGALPAPEMVLLTPTMAMAKSEVPAFLGKIRQNPVVQKLHDISKQEVPTLTGEEVFKIYNDLPVSSRNIFKGTAIYPQFQEASKLGGVARPEFRILEDVEMSRAEFNQLLDRYVMYLAKDEPSALSIQQLSTIATAARRQVDSPFVVTKAGEKVAVPKFNKLNAATTQLRIAEVFKPQLTRPTGFIKTWNEYIAPFLQVILPQKLRPRVMSPERAFAETTINAKLAAVPDDYKKVYDLALKEGMNHDEAFSLAITNPFRTAEGDLDVEDLFTNFFTSYYGGYDTIVDFASLRTGINPEKLVPKETLVELFSSAFRFASKEDYVYEAGDAILLAIAKNVVNQETVADVIKALAVGAKLLESRPLSTFLKDVDPAVLARVGDMLPQFSNRNIQIPMFATHIQKSQSNIINDVIQGQLVPTQALNVRGNFETVASQSTDLLRNTVGEIASRHFKVPTTISTKVQQLTSKYVRDSIINSILVMNNPKYKLSKKPVFEFVRDVVSELRTVEPITDISKAEATINLINDLFLNLGFRWDAKAAQRLFPKNAIVDIERSFTELIDNFITRKTPPMNISQVHRSIGEESVELLIGSVSPALTSLEVRAWLSNLASMVEETRKAEKGGLRVDPAYRALDISGLYNIDQMQRVIQRSVNLKKVEEAFTSYDYLKDTRMLGSVSPEIRDAMSRTLADGTMDFADAMREAIKKISVAETNQDYLNMMMQQTAAGASHSFFYQIPSFIKQNLLGGGFVPLPVYHMQNYLSGPLLLALTLNKTKDLTQIPVLGFLSDFLLFKNSKFTTPSGKIYAYEDIVDLAERNGLATATLNMAEINKNLLTEMIRYVGKTDGLIENRELARGFFSNIAKSIGLQGLSPWMQIAQNIDMAYRRKALVMALKAGETEEQAVQTARKALFDYNDLTAFERNYVAKYVWFYRFMRQNIVQTTVQFLDNPGKVARMAKLAKINFSKLLQGLTGEDGSIHDDISAYKDNRAFIKLIEGIDKERLAIYTPAMPIIDATTQLINAMGLFVWAASKIGLIELDSLSSNKLLEKGVQSLSLQPAAAMLQLGLQRQFGVNIQAEGLKQNAYLDPRFVAWMKATGTWDTMLAHINVEMTTTSKEGLTTFDGYYYKIADDSKMKWALFMDALKAVGLQRSSRDYATILQFVGPADMEAGTDITTGNWMLDALKFAGLINISTEPTLPQAEQNVRREIISTLQGGKK